MGMRGRTAVMSFYVEKVRPKVELKGNWCLVSVYEAYAFKVRSLGAKMNGIPTKRYDLQLVMVRVLYKQC